MHVVKILVRNSFQAVKISTSFAPASDKDAFCLSHVSGSSYCKMQSLNMLELPVVFHRE